MLDFCKPVLPKGKGYKKPVFPLHNTRELFSSCIPSTPLVFEFGYLANTLLPPSHSFPPAVAIIHSFNRYHHLTIASRLTLIAAE